ncbi:hypothetical protein FGIG_10633 [Fasciola gigantica]|uniref:Uncharacterized protein n=1 Tax=Fasciola gigantica TaxID=46835 RepID=A0A504Z6F8_FASGI|nr:hypothetical protein FGIG_10633 [Fasciola gigantica]
MGLLPKRTKKKPKNLSSEDDTPPINFGKKTLHHVVPLTRTAKWKERPRNIRSFRNHRGVSQY